MTYPRKVAGLKARYGVLGSRFERVVRSLEDTFSRYEDTLESVTRSLGFHLQGSLVRAEGLDFKVYDVTNLSDDVVLGIVHSLVNVLHDSEPIFPFKIIQVASITRGAVAGHKRWFEEQLACSEKVLKEHMPGVSSEFFNTWKEVYYSTIDGIGALTRKFSIYLILPCRIDGKTVVDEALPKTIGEFSELDLQRYFLKVFDNLTETNTESWEKAVLAQTFNAMSGKVSIAEEIVSPTKIRLRKQAVYGTHDGNLSEFSTVTIPGGHWRTSNIRKVILSCINSQDDKIIISQTCLPVSYQNARRYVKTSISDMREKLGIKQKRDLENKKVSEISFHDHILSHVNEYLSEHPMFEGSTKVILKTSSGRMKGLREDFLTKLKESNILYEIPKHWTEQEEGLRCAVPAIYREELERTEPLVGSDVEYALTYNSLPIQEKGVPIGFTEPDFSLIVLPIGIYCATGQNSAGKSFWAKWVVYMSLLQNPKNKVYVMDNKGASNTRDRNIAARVEDQKGWVDLCYAVGGTVVYSRDYDDRKNLYKALEDAGKGPFILYYPSVERKDNDECYLDWLLDHIKSKFDPGSMTEEDTRGIAVFDDVTSLFMDRDLGIKLADEVVTGCNAHGVMTLITLQSVEAVKNINIGAHSQLTSIINGYFAFTTPAYASYAESIGIKPVTEKLKELHDELVDTIGQRSSGLMGTWIPPEWRGVCTMITKNRQIYPARILVHDKAIELLSRKRTR
ncbi:hypothetical protein A2380_00585 [candidate division WWE3 bacterium RIFOXYB1_FULL_43_24]|uniref:Uncharacterized protein n=2 Tax=Katanobacteria TaxID=422282 RepID=A0A0G0YRG4_UNCKA|nr:MAG: hypothetical protein UU92_C0005G0046 [candidate division WWE3 bacterium GW2011_GWA1_42_12]KKS34860.1 MAG: hypothetical protein UU97_C0005G0026 [candidate division WWE3 bacterium GW2011_GWD1_42_14]KKS39215.1 MAG: hypothetical protein UV00_C0003G0047 [candidate division WWE3 bacterium GW2011_GWF1_42_14]KKS40713.1 MAG: hypothetical protein UV03_C0003G0026 [candidate division WWE3 bacterium GW2011_GWE1_42_16]KKS66868.1 MAG: hypothetical protein UV35_C0006G0047 [candidate division WWE3 bacte